MIILLLFGLPEKQARSLATRLKIEGTCFERVSTGFWKFNKARQSVVNGLPDKTEIYMLEIVYMK